MSRRTRKAVSIVLAMLLLTSVAVGLSAEGRFRLHLFEFGVKHGVEDRNSGITYSTASPEWRVFRNGPSWTNGDKMLVNRMVSDPPAASRREASIFMAGYNCGYYCFVGGIVVGIVVLVIGVFYFMRGQHHRAKYRLEASQDVVP